MDVTRLNAPFVFADFQKQVRLCDFIAVDQEMTGVSGKDIASDHLCGISPEKLYNHFRDGVLTYNAFQFGACLFTKAGETYEARPYNFSLLNKSGRMTLDLNAVEFHVTNNLDFNKWMKFSIPYCTKNEEAQMAAAKNEKNITDEARKMIETMKAEIVAFLPGEEPELKKKLKCTYPSAHLICATFEEELDYLVHIKFEAVQNTQDKVFTITKITEEDREFRRLRQKRYTEKKQFEKLGFRNFWKEIIASGKPIVGHNFLQDTMFMMHTHETDLPPTYAEFKNQLHSTFNTIYDTKAIATFINSDSEQEPFPNTGLGSIYTAIRKSFDRSPRTIEEKFVLPPGFYNYNDASVGELSKAHEGAYDAYMTGIVLVHFNELYAKAVEKSTNILLAFGSLFFTSITGEDQLIYPNTFLMETPEAYDQEEFGYFLFALFYEKPAEVKKTDACFRLHINYKADPHQNSISFYVKNGESLEQLNERKQKLIENISSFSINDTLAQTVKISSIQ